MKNFPDSPEAVAYALLLLILERDGGVTHNRPTQAWILDLFIECLKAALGEREEEKAVH